MKKISFLLLAFSLLFCACNKEDDDIRRLSSEELKQYSNAIAGSYKASGYSLVIADDDVMKFDFDSARIDIDNDEVQGMTVWHVPINLLANAKVLSDKPEIRKAFEERKSVSFTTTYSFENQIRSINGINRVSFTCKPVQTFLTCEYGGKTHRISVNIQPSVIYLPYTSNMKSVRAEFLNSVIRFDVTSMKIDEEEYKDVGFYISANIAEESEDVKVLEK